MNQNDTKMERPVALRCIVAIAGDESSGLMAQEPGYNSIRRRRSASECGVDVDTVRMRRSTSEPLLEGIVRGLVLS